MACRRRGRSAVRSWLVSPALLSGLAANATCTGRTGGLTIHLVYPCCPGCSGANIAQVNPRRSCRVLLVNPRWRGSGRIVLAVSCGDGGFMDRIGISRRITAAARTRFAGRGRAGVPRRSRGSVRTGSVAVVAAVAAFGVPGAGQSAALASSSPVLNWTQQAPATSPPGRFLASMAYDAATGNVVMFGGLGSRSVLGGTWTWDGSTWTKQIPKTSPVARTDASMAYDAATGNVVLFGGFSRHGIPLGGTWTWDGSTWTKQAPKTSPPVRGAASMAYDAATGTVVLFGGDVGVHHFWATPGPGTALPGQSRPLKPARLPGLVRRWPTTRPPPTSSCSAASPGVAARWTAPGPGTALPGQSRPLKPARLPGLTRRWPTTRPPPTSSCSAAVPRFSC